MLLFKLIKEVKILKEVKRKFERKKARRAKKGPANADLENSLIACNVNSPKIWKCWILTAASTTIAIRIFEVISLTTAIIKSTICAFSGDSLDVGTILGSN